LPFFGKNGGKMEKLWHKKRQNFVKTQKTQKTPRKLTRPRRGSDNCVPNFGTPFLYKKWLGAIFPAHFEKKKQYVVKNTLIGENTLNRYKHIKYN